MRYYLSQLLVEAHYASSGTFPPPPPSQHAGSAIVVGTLVRATATALAGGALGAASLGRVGRVEAVDAGAPIPYKVCAAPRDGGECSWYHLRDIEPAPPEPALEDEDLGPEDLGAAGLE